MLFMGHHTFLDLLYLGGLLQSRFFSLLLLLLSYYLRRVS